MVPIMLLLVLVFLLFVLVFGIYEMIKEKQRKKQCTAIVTAEVVSFTEIEVYDRESESYNYLKAPLYEYSYNREFCRIPGSTDSKWVKKMTIGSQVELLVDPENPKSYICPEEIRFVRIHGIKIACTVIGVLMLIFLVIVLAFKILYIIC
jgi:Protein of unknown function (DUF3592).